jgi:hypothetical protein
VAEEGREGLFQGAFTAHVANRAEQAGDDIVLLAQVEVAHIAVIEVHTRQPLAGNGEQPEFEVQPGDGVVLGEKLGVTAGAAGDIQQRRFFAVAWGRLQVRLHQLFDLLRLGVIVLKAVDCVVIGCGLLVGHRRSLAVHVVPEG